MKLAMEKVLYEAHVDILVGGHVHAYERTVCFFLHWSSVLCENANGLLCELICCLVAEGFLLAFASAFQGKPLCVHDEKSVHSYGL